MRESRIAGGQVGTRLKVISLLMFATMFASSFFIIVPSSATSNTTGFQVINVAWGSATNRTGASPGDSNIPLTITLDYTFPNTATSVQGLLQLPEGFSLYNGSTTDYSAISQIMPTGTIFTMTFYSIYLANSLKLGTYIFTLNLSWSAAGYAYILNQTSSVTISVEGTPKLEFQSSTNSLTPGQLNNVSLTIYNDGTGSASAISVSASSQTAGILNSIPEIQNLSAGTSATYTLELYLPKSATGSVVPLLISSSYKDPYGNTKSASQTINFYGSSFNEPSLDYTVKQRTLLPGEINNVTVVLTNTGSGEALDIVTTISGSSQSVSSVSDFPKVDSIGPGSSYSTVLSIYVSDSAASTPLTLTFSASYADNYGNTGSASQSEGFQIEAASSATANTSLSITTLSNSVTSGAVDKVTFLVENIGNSTIFAPTYTITATQPLVVAGNSTYSSVGTSITPGQSQIFVAYLTASPSSTSGVYSATIEVSFKDQYGTIHNQSYSVAIMLTGSVELVIQNEAFSQNATAITVTGSILDEGSASAYYATVTAHLNGSKTATGSADYVGEIDPNSPVPFTATIPYRAQSSNNMGNISVFIEYKNSLGQIMNSTSSSTTELKSISQILPSNSTTTPNTTNQNGLLGLTLLELIIIVTVVIVALGIGVVAAVRRRQNRRQSGASSGAGQVS